MTETSPKTLLRTIPAIDALLSHPSLEELRRRLPQELLVTALRSTLDIVRTRILENSADDLIDEDHISPDAICDLAIHAIAQSLSPSLVPVLNGTGVVLHTNLGRAPISTAALNRLQDVARGYSNLEYDLEARGRGSRHVHAEALLRDLLGVEAAMIVNNCAAAVLLLVTALARGHEVIVSRGELIEIGGSFRIPEVMEVSGATLREVGTTNRTRIDDYSAAIGDDTALLLKANRSNFEVVGFTETVETEALAALGREHGVPTALDLGSGLLIDLTPYGITGATTVQEAVASGVDLVCFSGDKLLGGPQAGIIVGRQELITRLRKDPLTRALRVDKLTFAALEATLVAYLDGSWKESVSALGMLTLDEDTLQARAESLRDAIQAALPKESALDVSLASIHGMVGGGTLPTTELPSAAVVLRHSSRSATALEAALRGGSPPLIARIEDEAVLIDVRTLLEDALETAAKVIAIAAG